LNAAQELLKHSAGKCISDLWIMYETGSNTLRFLDIDLPS